MPIPKFKGSEQQILQRIEDAKELRRHAQEDEEEQSDYALGKILGRGSYGSVHEAMNLKTGEMVAIKTIIINANRQKLFLDLAEKELKAMRMLRHPHVVGVRGSYFDSLKNEFYIIMELISGRSLRDVLNTMGAFHETVTRKFTRQILVALNYCHQNCVIHRDIKGENILLTIAGQIKLCDLGGAKLRDEANEGDKSERSLTYSYTPLWVAPEAITTGKYNDRVDIWALGCVVIEMASGKKPWSEMNWTMPTQALFHIGQHGNIPLIPSNLSPAGQDFCRKCLIRNPDERPSAEELLKHPFIATVDPMAPGEVGEDSTQMAELNYFVEKQIQLGQGSSKDSSSLVSTHAPTTLPLPSPPPPAQANDNPMDSNDIPPPPAYPHPDDLPPPPPPAPVESPSKGSPTSHLYPFTNAAAPMAVLDKSTGGKLSLSHVNGQLTQAVEQLNIVYHIPIDKNPTPFTASGSNSCSNSNSVRTNPESRIFQYEPYSDDGTSSMSMSMSRISFVDEEFQIAAESVRSTSFRPQCP